MVNNQELVISSDKMTYLSLAQGQALRDECDTHAKKDLITIYQNRHHKYNQLSLEQFLLSSLHTINIQQKNKGQFQHYQQ
jgi:hypothetical protein